MGRKKIDTTCKLPERKINSTFMKRKQGAINKARQLGKLCDVDVALIIFYPRNDAVIAVSHGGRVDEVIRKFQLFKQQHLEKVKFFEDLRLGPHEFEPFNLQQYHMHPNAQVMPLLPTLEMPQRTVGIPTCQGESFYTQTQCNNGSANGQQQLPQGRPLPLAPPTSDFSYSNFGQ